MKTIIYTIILILFISSCSNNENDFDASGSFEAEETIISSEVSGTIKQFTIEEGEELNSGELIGYIDSTQWYLKKKQLVAQINALLSNKPDILVQLASLQEQLKSAQKEEERFRNLVESDAATQKQLDDIISQINVIEKQISAKKSSLDIATRNIYKNVEPLQIQIEQIEDQLEKCKIVNPLDGTVLVKYAYANEMAARGKPLYKIADLSTIILRVYISGDQLPKVKLNQTLKVFTDDGNGGFNETVGVVSWISNKAEFTPKTVQTKNERANMVYAVKIKVKNNGMYKIGMYGEVKFL
jgi:HlyD family secretion protein